MAPTRNFKQTGTEHVERDPEFAKKLLDESQAGIIELSRDDQECFARALLSPPKPAPALKRAFARRKKLLRTE